MDVLYPPYWPLISAVIFTAIIWMTGSLSLLQRRFIRTCSFVVLFTPEIVAAHGAAIFPLALAPIWILLVRFNVPLAPLLVSVLLAIVFGFLLVHLYRKRRM